MTEMKRIRIFINDTFKEELPILGTPKPFQINCLWNNNFYDYNFR